MFKCSLHVHHLIINIMSIIMIVCSNSNAMWLASIFKLARPALLMFIFVCNKKWFLSVLCFYMCGYILYIIYKNM